MITSILAAVICGFSMPANQPQFGLSDCVLLARVVGGDTTICTDGLRTDINGDGKTDARDLVIAVEYVANGGAAADYARQMEPVWFPVYDAFTLECIECPDAGNLEFEAVVSVSDGDGDGCIVNVDPWYNRISYDDVEMPRGVVVSFFCYDLDHDGEIFAQMDYLLPEMEV